MRFSLDDMKARHGSIATVTWLIGGTALFLFDGGLNSLFSLKAAAFLFVGMFVAAVAVGNATWWLQQRLVKYLLKKFPDPFDPKAVRSISNVGSWLTLVDVLIGIVFVVWVYNSFFWMT